MIITKVRVKHMSQLISRFPTCQYPSNPEERCGHQSINVHDLYPLTVQSRAQFVPVWWFPLRNSHERQNERQRPHQFSSSGDSISCGCGLLILYYPVTEYSKTQYNSVYSNHMSHNTYPIIKLHYEVVGVVTWSKHQVNDSVHSKLSHWHQTLSTKMLSKLKQVQHKIISLLPLSLTHFHGKPWRL